MLSLKKGQKSSNFYSLKAQNTSFFIVEGAQCDICCLLEVTRADSSGRHL